MKKLFVSVLALLFLTACGGGGVSLRSDTAEIAAGATAATAGYLIGTNNPDKITDWVKWADKLLDFEQGASVVSFESLLAKGFDLVVDEPFLELQFNKLIRLLEFPELQPPEIPFLKAEYLEYIKLIVGDFRDGLLAGLEEAQRK